MEVSSVVHWVWSNGLYLMLIETQIFTFSYLNGISYALTLSKFT